MSNPKRFTGRLLYFAAAIFFLCSLGILIEIDTAQVSTEAVSSVFWTAIFFWASLWLSQIELGNRSLWPYSAYFLLFPPLVAGLAAVEIYDDTSMAGSLTRYEYCIRVWLIGLTTTLIFRLWNWLPVHRFMQHQWAAWTKNLSDLSKTLVFWIGLLLVLKLDATTFFSSTSGSIRQELFPFENNIQGIVTLAILLLFVPLLLTRIFSSVSGTIISLSSYGLLLVFHKVFTGQIRSFDFWSALSGEDFLILIYLPLILLLSLLSPFRTGELHLDRKHYRSTALISLVLAGISFGWVAMNYNLPVLTKWRFARRWQIAYEANKPGFSITLKSDGEGVNFEQWFDIELDVSINRIKNTMGQLPKLPGGITIRNANTDLDTKPIAESEYTYVNFENGELTLRQIEDMNGRRGKSTNRSFRSTFYTNFKNVKISNEPLYRISAPPTHVL